jgi:hypothetical protein
MTPTPLTTPYRYHAFGASIHSAVALPDLEPGQGEADLRIIPGRVERAMPPPAADGRSVLVAGADVYLRWAAAGSFYLQRGRTIVYDAAPDALAESLQICLTGPVLGVAMHQRGALMLHASAVQMGDGVVAFLAESGCGKTTLAAALYAQGHTLVSDDVLAVTGVADGAPTVQPAIPRLKLDPDLLGIIGLAAGAARQFHPADRRRALWAADRFARGPLPLRRLYVLSIGPSQAVALLSPAETMIALTRHSYAQRILGAPGTTHEVFHATARLAATTPAFQLTRQPELAALPDLIRLVQGHYAH